MFADCAKCLLFNNLFLWCSVGDILWLFNIASYKWQFSIINVSLPKGNLHYFWLLRQFSSVTSYWTVLRSSRVTWPCYTWKKYWYIICRCYPNIPINVPIKKRKHYIPIIYIYVYTCNIYMYIWDRWLYIKHIPSMFHWYSHVAWEIPSKTQGNPLIPSFDRSFPGLSSVKATDRRSEPDLWGREKSQQNTAENMGNTVWKVGTSNLVDGLEHVVYLSIYWE